MSPGDSRRSFGHRCLEFLYLCNSSNSLCNLEELTCAKKDLKSYLESRINNLWSNRNKLLITWGVNTWGAAWHDRLFSMLTYCHLIKAWSFREKHDQCHYVRSSSGAKGDKIRKLYSHVLLILEM